MTTNPPRQLSAGEMTSLSLDDIIMTAPLDEAITVAIGRASTCWSSLDGFGVFDEQTAIRIVDAILARISAEMGRGS